ncbi:hypothetical protein VIGAN_02080300 [Vigna angularis var. angularis]|uniref:Uncharacterized protein n=1 Tax=Vigna angularis var. angularis TaxID=157739 RepID=A0A0S3RCA8_PHAAN|nr:hypothetical protein VIGAN_02080300 [Vigna angularis var. angularis]
MRESTYIERTTMIRSQLHLNIQLLPLLLKQNLENDKNPFKQTCVCIFVKWKNLFHGFYFLHWNGKNPLKDMAFQTYCLVLKVI